jgi:hypothetical protein
MLCGNKDALLLYPVAEAGFSIAETPYPNKMLRLTHILSQQEVAGPTDAAESSFHRVLLMTFYSTG